ncbi:choline dehydrogenase [Mucilaginibacter rubeus]|uniref:Choline dehydrogenase n=2 Tax=Mucilaginibacter TaxID=423349 RepID=A0AAE6JDD3_9SPHI|nr:MULTISPECIES: GMC family oxidoreductase N-terminal domain-containing protein [Mucilaginibacter]QEM03624.1 choline dehydrogenase [Mucilaginibacter rubeus]QEM16235.1 choline dehydrogenase [Mucilaginibacter gossypii]QTE41006.1 GMC family oxidoreductase N-terminal domain-containing protein [Mucilaginibacter rubeus]QTE47609.1 GMC family oxidoreductase N-terminal domain-containing protein [Mucilaginibacter rubeus]QTE59000.1 GMC family oxidoreductase N-terminal domain-containing protein [Mucilagin
MKKLEETVNVSAEGKSRLTISYDYIIVGAGSAGCVLARRLSESTEANILILEAGEGADDLDRIKNPLRWLENIGSAQDYLYQYQPTPVINNRIIYAPRGKLLGGSGSINAMVWARGNKHDYDDWEKAGNQGWDYGSVLPLFKKIEDWDTGANALHGAGGPIHVARPANLHQIDAAVIRAAGTYGLPYMDDSNIAEPLGAGPMSMNIDKGTRSSPFTGYLKPVMHAENLTILTGARVIKLIIDNEKCTGLAFIKDGEVVNVQALKETILCAGAIESPRILMLSGIGDADELKKTGIETKVNLPGVGKNFQDHPLVSVTYQFLKPLGELTYNLGGINLYWKSNPELKKADLMLIPIQYPILTAEISERYPVPENAFSVFVTLVDVKSRGYIRMTGASPDSPLEIQPNLMQDPDDFEALVKGIEFCMDLAEEPELNAILKSWVAPDRRLDRSEIRHFLRDACSTYFHPAGTCSMGKGGDAVVNDRLKVYGVEGLTIADASVMPRIPTANTNAPTLMIAEFAAEVLLGIR